MKKFSIKTLGCRVNQYDTQYVREQLLRAGWKEPEEGEGSDLCVINTCTITEKSDTKAKYFLRQARRENPNAKIVLTGCFTDKMRQLDGVDVFVSNLDKDQFLVKTGLVSKEEAFEILGSNFHISQFEGRTRAFVKVQDGCDAYCSFCIVPFTRGRSKSRSVEQLLQEVRALVLNGYQEVVLTGVHLGSYGLKKEDPNSLADVIETISQIPGLKRLRLSSLEPMGLTPELIKRLSQLKNLCPHFHLPVQSGNNRVLEQMRRHYTVEGFQHHADLIYKYFNQPSISTDIIVGFPTETEVEFQDTMHLAKAVQFSKTHIFPYSHRKGTLASRMEAVPQKILDERVKQLTELTDQLAYEHKLPFIGKEQDVLIEEKDKQGNLQGFTPNYLKVRFPGEESLKNKIVPIRLKQASSPYFDGELVQQNA